MSDDLPEPVVKGSEGSPTFLNAVPPGAENMVGDQDASPSAPPPQVPSDSIQPTLPPPVPSDSSEKAGK